MHMTLDEAETLVFNVFHSNGVRDDAARSVARASCNPKPPDRAAMGCGACPPM